MKNVIPLLLFILSFFGCSRIEYATNRLAIHLFEDTKTKATLSIEEAASDAVLSLLLELDQNSRHGQIRSISSLEYSDSLVDSEEGLVLDSPVFICNFKGDSGYAIVTGDGCPTVLCVTDSGHFHLGDTLPFGAIAMLSESAFCFKNNLRNRNNEPWSVYPQDSVYVQWSTLNVGTIHGTRVSCNWGQRARFNSQCPVLSNGKRAAAGCLPVAVAQIMYYHGKNATYDSFYYNWDNMHQIIDSTSCPMYVAGWNSVSKLLRTLGDEENLWANYTINGTTSKWSRAPQTFLNFGYSNGGINTDFNYWNLSYDIIHGCPVLLYGCNTLLVQSDSRSQVDTSYTGAHAWVADQFVKVLRRVNVYDIFTFELLYTADVYQNYIHCNWGWHGRHNGFFLSKEFNVSDPLYIPTKSQVDTLEGSSYKYQLKQITSIRP